MSLISVIVPVYKAEQYLHRCVDSILAQTYTDFELLLIDDGSPDRSGEICDEYARQDSRVRVFHKQNGGASSARNKGLDHANGEWVSFVDSDDWIDKYYLETLCCTDDADLVISSIALSAGDTWKTEDAIYTLKDFIHKYSDNLLVRSPCGKLYSNAFIQNNNIRYDERVRFGEDMIFNLYYFAYCSKIKLLSYTGYVYFYDGTPHPIKYGLSFDEIYYALNKSIIKKREISEACGAVFDTYSDFVIYFDMCPVKNMVNKEYLEGYFNLCKRFDPELDRCKFYNHPLYSPVLKCIPAIKKMYEEKNYSVAIDLCKTLYVLASNENVAYRFPFKDYYLWFFLIKNKRFTLLSYMMKFYFSLKKLKSTI